MWPLTRSSRLGFRGSERRRQTTRVTLECLEDRTVPSTLEFVSHDPNDWPMFNHDAAGTRSNPAEHRLSNESPVGKAIIGRKKGEVVEVAAPRGKLKFKIMDIKAA